MDSASRIIGQSHCIRDLRHLIEQVAPTEAPVLIIGESGTGKELVAAEVHRLSGRTKKRLVPVNIAAIPAELVESSLFGHVKGAFTGAQESREGFCAAANGGTLFLDEIGEMALSLQPKLLRFLQEGTIQRVGSDEEIQCDTRVIAATNRDPADLVEKALLREDLYYRLDVIRIQLPALRERESDVILLANAFLKRACERNRRDLLSFSQEAMDTMLSFPWPGNIRQLENVVERLSVLAKAPVIQASDLHQWIRPEKNASPTPNGTQKYPKDNNFRAASHLGLTKYEAMERDMILDALRVCDGNVVAAAKHLGLGQATVYRKIKAYKINNKPNSKAPNGSQSSLVVR